MGGSIYLLRHAQTKINFQLPPKYWELSDEGTSQSIQIVPKLIKILNSSIKNQQLMLWGSSEQKTISTLTPFSQHLQLSIHTCNFFDEYNSYLAPIPDRAQFFQSKLQIFTDYSLIDPFDAKNHPFEALKQFKRQLHSLLDDHPSHDHLICTHGTILTLFLGENLRTLQNPISFFKIWQGIPFCGFGEMNSLLASKKFENLLP